jgi:L-aminopeptidase/D-esterase-like protein
MTVAELGVEGLLVGHWTDRQGLTGCTAVIAPAGVVGSLDVRGAAPGTRETDLLSPFASVGQVQAIVLCGGSARGLGAAQGVAEYLEEQGWGYSTPYGLIPLVPAAVIYDLGMGDSQARPLAEHGYLAAAAAAREFTEGSVGVGTGATVGKMLLEAGWMKGGVASARLTLPGGATVAALTVVNAFGDVLGPDGRVLAGARKPDGSFLNSHRYILSLEDHPHFNRMMEHTTLSVVVTDALFSKAQCAAVARMAHDGLARSISPVHTPVDGDVVFVLSTGRERSNVFQAGVAAAEVVARSIRRAVEISEGLGIPALAGAAGQLADQAADLADEAGALADEPGALADEGGGVTAGEGTPGGDGRARPGG